jgi:hypothetical protein
VWILKWKKQTYVCEIRNLGYVNSEHLYNKQNTTNLTTTKAPLLMWHMLNKVSASILAISNGEKRISEPENKISLY